LDNCGEFLNMTVFAELMNATGRPILVEECHWGGGAPGTWGDGGKLNSGPNKVSPAKWCPYNFFRTSNDIQAEWSSVFSNLQSVAPHQPWLGSAGEVLTGPGCFAYPDSLEVGNLKSTARQGPSMDSMMELRMHRSNFGAWCVVSSPLILGHDLTDDAVMDTIWPIITNTHAINVSQHFDEASSRHPGGLVRR
jgi:alpha-galactosidase